MPHVDHIVNGEKWPSVTEVLRVSDQPWKWAWYRSSVKKNGWRGWQKNDAMGRRGMSFGTDFHGVLEAKLTGQSYSTWISAPRFRAHTERCAEVVYQWVRDSGACILVLEQHLVNEPARYHGSFDAVVIMPDKTVEVWDWKTNNQEDPYHAVQLSAYATMWNLRNPSYQIDTGRIIQVDKKAKTPKVKPHLFTELHYYYKLFESLRDNWDFAHSKGQWERTDE